MKICVKTTERRNRQPLRRPAYLTGRLALPVPPGALGYRALLSMADGSVRSLTKSVTTTGCVSGYPSVSIWSWACSGPANLIASSPPPSGL